MASAASKDSKASLAPAVPNTSQNPAAVLTTIHTLSQRDELAGFIEGSEGKTLLIEFFAEWCGPCKLISNKIEEWTQIYDLTVIKIDVDEMEEIAIEYDVAGIPTFVLIKDKQKVEQIEGSQEEPIVGILEKYCEKRSAYKKTVNSLLTSQEAFVNRNLPITEKTGQAVESERNLREGNN